MVGERALVVARFLYGVMLSVCGGIFGGLPRKE